jgi:hypothetical protein
VDICVGYWCTYMHVKRWLVEISVFNSLWFTRMFNGKLYVYQIIYVYCCEYTCSFWACSFYWLSLEWFYDIPRRSSSALPQTIPLWYRVHLCTRSTRPTVKGVYSIIATLYVMLAVLLAASKSTFQSHSSTEANIMCHSIEVLRVSTKHSEKSSSSKYRKLFHIYLQTLELVLTVDDNVPAFSSRVSRYYLLDSPIPCL